MVKINNVVLLSGLIVGLATGAQAREVSCSVERSLKSENTNASISLTIVNRSGGYRNIMWIDHSGNAVSYNGLNDGESYVQSTYVGHPWMATNGPGDCERIYVPQRSGTWTINP